MCLIAKSTSYSYLYNKGKETQQTILFYMQHQKKGMQPPSATETAMKKQLHVITSMQQTCTSIIQSPCTLMTPVGIKFLTMELNSAKRFSNGLVNIILPEERYFYALSCTCDKEENQNPHEKLNFRPSANSTLR